MHNFTCLVVLFQKAPSILLAENSSFLLVLTVNSFLFFIRAILSSPLFEESFFLKAVILQIPSTNVKSKYWFIDLNRFPSQGIFMPYLLLKHTIFRRKVLFSYPF
jgi:hypothetical protein